MRQFNLETQAWEGEDEQTETLGSLEFLQSVYRDGGQPLGVRIRCAVEALQYERPKLTAVATADLNGNSFAELLDKAIERTARVKAPPRMIDVTPVPVEPHPASELKGPFARLRRRI
jgi:hypothetical protein